jgi:hypothetical protein
MPTQGESKPDSGALQATEHVAGAHDLLKVLQDKIGEHPEIRDNIWWGCYSHVCPQQEQ